MCRALTACALARPQGGEIQAFGPIKVEVRDGYVVAASDGSGHRWNAATPRAVSRLLTHLIVLAAVAAPLGVTAASAHAPRAVARIQVSGAAVDHPEAIATLPAGEADAPTPAPTGLALLAQKNTLAAAPAIAGGAGSHFPWGWCTYYVSTKRYIPWSGDAITWWGAARALGWPTGQVPMVGAIMVTRESGYGHVAYVESVSGSCFTVSEMNYKGFGVVDRRTICPGQVPVVGFIY